MPIKPDQLTEEQKLARQISGMVDSENLIRRLVIENKHSDQIHDTIERNCRHLEIMFERDIIKNSSTDLTRFEEAIALGKAFISAQ